jgi:hypothetical protein
MFEFNHLDKVKQTYLEHFCEGMTYSFMSLRASCYFFVHSLNPDLFEFDGSMQIEKLNKELMDKKMKIN